MGLYRVIDKKPQYIEEGTKLGLEELKNMPDKYGKLDHLLGKPFSPKMLKEIQAYASGKLENVIPKNVARHHIFKWLEKMFPRNFLTSDIIGMVGVIETPMGNNTIHATCPNKKGVCNVSTWVHERSSYHIIFVEEVDRYRIEGYFDFIQVQEYLESKGFLVTQKNSYNPLITISDWKDTIKPIETFLIEMNGFIKGVDVRDLKV